MPQVFNPLTGQMEELPDYADTEGYVQPPPRRLTSADWRLTALGDQQPPTDFGAQEQVPSDYWTRVAQATGGHPFGPVYLRRKPHGIEAALAFLSGYGNAKAGGALNRAKDVEARNKRASEAASTLAQHRHELTRDELNDMRDLQRGITLKNIASPNQATPAKDDLINVVDPKTGKRKTIRQSQWQGEDLFIPPKDESSAKRVRINATQVKQLTDDASVIGQTQDIAKTYRPEFVGPLAGRVGGLKSKLGGQSPAESDFRVAVSSYVAAARHMLYGSALTRQEIESALGNLPDPNDPPEVFTSKLKITQRNLIRAARANRQGLEGMGVDLSGMNQLPEEVELFSMTGAKPSGPNSSMASGDQKPLASQTKKESPDDKVMIERNGQRGLISRKFLKPTDKVIQ